MVDPATYTNNDIIIISFLVLGKDLPFPYINPDYNSPLIY